MARLGVMLAYAPVHHLLFYAVAGGSSQCAPAISRWSRPPPTPAASPSSPTTKKPAKIAGHRRPHRHPRPRHRRARQRQRDANRGRRAGLPAPRARGFVPEAIDLGEDGPSVLACGGHLKATLTFTRGQRSVCLPAHRRSLRRRNFSFLRRERRASKNLLDVEPEAVACDLHPDYLSTRFAERFFRARAAFPASRRPCRGHRSRTWRNGEIFGAALDGTGLAATAPPGAASF